MQGIKNTCNTYDLLLLAVSCEVETRSPAKHLMYPLPCITLMTLFSFFSGFVNICDGWKGRAGVGDGLERHPDEGRADSVDGQCVSWSFTDAAGAAPSLYAAYASSVNL